MEQNNMVAKTIIKEVLDFHNIEATIVDKAFKYYTKLPKKVDGVYVLVDNQDRVIYVGKGRIATRQRKHWPKATGAFGAKDPKGWRWLYQNFTTQPNGSDPTEWTVLYVILYKQTELSAVEGSLIHKLQPLANDETFKDNGRTI
jgi:hypothetical protein